MPSNNAFGAALKRVRISKGLTQEDFSDTSSRTYISTLERGLKSPTLEKIDAIASTLQMHPLSLLTLAYLPKNKSEQKIEKLLEHVNSEILKLLSKCD